MTITELWAIFNMVMFHFNILERMILSRRVENILIKNDTPPHKKDNN